MLRDERTNAPAINRLPMAASAKFCLMFVSIVVSVLVCLMGQM